MEVYWYNQCRTLTKDMKLRGPYVQGYQQVVRFFSCLQIYDVLT